MSSSPIRVAFAADEAYLGYAKIALASLLFHHRDGVELFFLHSGLSPRALSAFDSLHNIAEFSLTSVPIEDSFLNSWPDLRWSRAAYLRLLLPSLLPDCEKIIYLDSDLLVLSDISELWELGLDNHACAAVAGRVAPEHRRKIGLAEGTGYFNSGVMMFNPAKMKRDGDEENFIRLFSRHGDAIKYPDQDILNLAYERNWKKLPLRWNLITSVYRNPPDSALYSEEETFEALKNPGIAHFTGTHKPWLFRQSMHHPYGFLYRKYAQLADADPALLRRLFWKSVLRKRVAPPKKQVPWNASILAPDR